MAERTMKTKIELSGEKEYTNALKSVNGEARLTSSQLSKLKAEYEGQLNSLDYLQQKSEALGKAYKLASKKVDTMREALQNSEKIQSEYGQKVDATKQAIANLTEEMSKLDTNTDEGADSYQKMLQELNKLNEELDVNEKTYAAASDSVQNWSTKLNSAYVSKKRLGQQVAATNKYLEEAKTSSDECAVSIDEFGKQVKQAADDTQDMAQDLGKAETAMESTSATTIAVGNLMADAMKATAEKAKELAESLTTAGTEYQQSQAKMSAATGATGDELERLNTVAKNVFSQGLGDSMADAYDGVTAVKNATGLMDDELQKAVESGYALRDTFGFELQESARTADSMMKNFGITAEEAYNIIAVGAQNGANKNGDLLDVLNEYSAQYAALGLDADQFIQSLISGADAGVFSIDKVGDAVKEFNIQAKDGSDTSREAFELLGLSADNMTAKFAAGGESAKTALFEVVNSLAAMEDPVKKNAAAVSLFGTMYEDLEENLLPILASMEDASETTYDAMGQINEVRYNDLQTQWEAIKRKIVVGTLPQLNTALEKVGDTLESPQMTESAEEIGESLGDLAESGGELAEKVLPVLADGLGLLVDGADVVLQVLPELISTMVLYKVTAVAMDIAQQGLNATLNLNPYAAVAGLLAGVVTALAHAVIEANSMDDATKALNDSLDATREKASAEREEIEANEAAALNLVKQIEALSNKENKSAEEKQRLAGLVSSLNQLVPDLGASYDELSDSINMSTGEMKKFIIQSAKLQAVESLEGELADLYVDQAKALDNLTKKKNAAIQVSRDYQRQQVELNKAFEEGTITQSYYEGQLSALEADVSAAEKATREAEDAYTGINEAVSEAEEQLLGYSDAIGIGTEATEENTEATEENTAATEDAAEATEEYLQSVEEMAQVLDGAGVAVDGLAEKLVEQGLAASDVESKIGSYKDTTLNAFEVIEQEQELSVEKMIETLNTNAQITQDWAEGIAQLYSQTGGSITTEFIQWFEALGPSYLPILDQLTADTSGKLLGELALAWSNGSMEAVNAALIAMGVLPAEAAAIAASASQQSGEQFSADTTAYSQAGTAAQEAYISSLSEITPEASSVLSELKGEIEDRLSDIRSQMASDGATAGTDMMSKMSGAIRAGQGKITAAVGSAADAAYARMSGKDWHGLGYDSAAGVAQGFRYGSPLITAAANAAMDNALASAKRRAGVNSPATVWRDDLGVWLPSGAAEGVEEGTPDLLDAVRISMDRAMETARKTLDGARGVSIYDFVPTMDSVSTHETVNHITNNYGSTQAVKQSAMVGTATNSYLREILEVLKSTGGITPAQVAKALGGAMDAELGRRARRSEREG